MNNQNNNHKQISYFFPKGATALIIMRALNSNISSFNDLADFLRYLGKSLSTQNKKIYRQRRNRVLKYALKRLFEYHLISKGEVPGTYSFELNYLGYLSFLKDNASELYDRIKFDISRAILQLNTEILDAQRRLIQKFWAELMNPKSYLRREKNPVKEYNEFTDILRSDGVDTYSAGVYRKLNITGEPYMTDREQIELLEFFFRSVGFSESDVDSAIGDIVINHRKESQWLGEKLSEFLSDKSVPDENLLARPSRNVSSWYTAGEEKALKAIIGKEVSLNYSSVKLTSPLKPIELLRGRPWWFNEFQKAIFKMERQREGKE
ncbi:MAG: hypothetical protein QXO75_06865 [Nitrososphaerota archaeon]